MSELHPAVRRVLTGHRVESWRVDLLAADDTPLGMLDGVSGGSLDYSVHATIRGTGSLTVAGDAVTGVPWHQVRVQPWCILTDPGTGQVHEWPLGVYLPTTPRVRHTDTGPAAEVELYDKLVVLDQDKLAETWTVDAGRVLTEAVAEVIAAAGETRVAITPSSATVATAMVWEAGTSRLRVVNDLLDAGNYFSLWADGYGVLRAAPYVVPARRGVAWDFHDDHESVYTPELDLEQDAFEVPNLVVLVGTTSGETEAPKAEARNEDPASPWSFQSRGRWITHHETGVEAASVTVLGDLAARRLVELSQVTATFEVEHAWVPLALNDAVSLRNQGAGVDVRCVVQAQSLSWDTDNPGRLVRSTLRQVL